MTTSSAHTVAHWLWQRYGVCRKTGYRWIDRYLPHEPVRVEERWRRP